MERLRIARMARETFARWCNNRMMWFKIGNFADNLFEQTQIGVLMAISCYFLFVNPSFQAKHILLLSLLPYLSANVLEMKEYVRTNNLMSSVLYSKSLVTFGRGAHTIPRNYFLFNFIFGCIHSLVTLEFTVLSQISKLDLVMIFTLNIVIVFIDITRRIGMSTFYELSSPEHLRKAQEDITRYYDYYERTPKKINKFYLFTRIDYCFVCLSQLFVFLSIRALLVHYCVENFSSTAEKMWILLALAGPFSLIETISDLKDLRRWKTYADIIYEKKRFLAFGSHSTNVARGFFAINVGYYICIYGFTIRFWKHNEIPTFDMVLIVSLSIFGMAVHFLLRRFATEFYMVLVKKDTYIRDHQAKNRRLNDINVEEGMQLEQKHI